MLETQRPLKVFLSYASQDRPVVRELSRRLVGEGWIDTWLDEKKLLPGQDWRLAIEEAVEDSDIVIICLSVHSVSKEGHVQKELRYAREMALEKPEETIFLIPLRFDECEVPRGLRFYQWVDYFGERKAEGYDSLVESLKLRYEQKLRLEQEEGSRQEKSRKEREADEKIAREKAEQESAKKAQLEAEKLAKQKAAKEKAEREATEKAAREKVEKEAAEKVRLEARRKAAKEKAEREAAEKVAREKTEREAAKKAAREEEKRVLAEKATREEEKRKSDEAVQKYSQVEVQEPAVSTNTQPLFWIVGIIFAIILVIWVSSLNGTPSTPATTSTRTSLPQVSVSSTSTKTILPSTVIDTPVPTAVTLPIQAGTNLPFTPPEITTKNSNLVQLIRLIETGDASQLSFSPTGEFLAAGFTDRIVLFDSRTLKELRFIPVGETSVISIAFSPDGSIIAAGTSDGTIFLWNAYDGSVFQTFTGLNSFVWDIVFSPDGKTLASSDDEGIIQLWNISNGTSSTLGAFSDRNITSLVFSNDGKVLAFGTFNKWNGENDIIYFWNISSNKYSVIQGVDTNDLAYSPDGKILVGAGWKTINMWFVSNNSLIRALDENSQGVDFSPNGDIFATGGKTHVRLWQVSDGELLKSLPVNTDTAASEFSPDGTILATVSSDGVIRLWGVKP